MNNRLSFYNLLTEKEKELVKDNTIERTYKKDIMLKKVSLSWGVQTYS